MTSVELAFEQSAPPPRVNRREIMVGAALASAALVSGAVRFRSQEVASQRQWPLEKIVPDRIGAWSHAAKGDRLIPTGERAEEEAYDGLLTRYYSSDQGGTIMFLIAFGNAQSGNAQIHRPEACYPASGYNLHSEGLTSLRAPGTIVHARTMTAEAPGRVEQILYWSRIGDRFPTSSPSQRWVTFRQAFGGAVPDGALVRISMIHPDQPAALRVLKGFAATLLAVPDAGLRELLTGRR